MPGGKANFERLLDAATSQMLLEPNWVTNLEICDSVRQNDVTSKYALQAIRKRMKDSNPHVCKYALVVLETCVKNCGEAFHEELASHEFMNEIRNLAQTGSAPVKEQVLSMLQAWNHAFRNNTKYQPILATYNLMKMEGYNFPAMSESDAMFSSDTAPSWKEGDVCHLCRVKFGTFTRQHHCRACGEVFCNSCSSKKSIIPKIGIEREVRVCDPCFDEINPNASSNNSGGAAASGKTDASGGGGGGDDELPAEYLNSALAKEPQTKPKINENEAKQQEEDELQLALALSLSQEEAAKSQKKNWSAPAAISSAPPSMSHTPTPSPYQSLGGSVSEVKSSSTSPYSSPYSSSMTSLSEASKGSSELDKYLDRSYWEKKNQESATRAPSAPVVMETQQPAAQQQVMTNGDVYASVPYQTPQGAIADVVVEDEVEDENERFQSDAFVNTMEKSIDMFVQQMTKLQTKGKHIALDTSVQSLFHSLSAMHPQLLQLIEDEAESKAKYEAMLQKLAVIREARETLDDMRAQHQEKMRQQELEQEMLRRMQMEQKLELMRQQKQEYLEYQHQLQLQRQVELETYQREKMMQKQVPFNGPMGMMPGYGAGYPMVPPGQQPIPTGYAAPDSLEGNIVMPPPYASLTKQQPGMQPALPTQDLAASQQPGAGYQSAAIPKQPQQPPAGQWNQPPPPPPSSQPSAIPNQRVPAQQPGQQPMSLPPNTQQMPPQSQQQPPPPIPPNQPQHQAPLPASHPYHQQPPPAQPQRPAQQTQPPPQGQFQQPTTQQQAPLAQQPNQFQQQQPQQFNQPPPNNQQNIPPQQQTPQPQQVQPPNQQYQQPQQQMAPQHQPQQTQIPPQQVQQPPQHVPQQAQPLQQQVPQQGQQHPQQVAHQPQQPPQQPPQQIPQQIPQQPQQIPQPPQQVPQPPQQVPQQPQQQYTQQPQQYGGQQPQPQYQQNPQQQGYYDQQPQQPQQQAYEERMSANMKDLQLISFD
ncbi:hepatocyte growth factor-regulated tyrosine kinase substrate-like [Clytia hemisphaerica]|uniref:Hepatocyte growth factor-regulated tyrosine kinase substrate n=1 Tax=Clytia hemisphaerica TaxID=252671 RepID=A0A7M5UNX1_9CNID